MLKLIDVACFRQHIVSGPVPSWDMECMHCIGCVHRYTEYGGQVARAEAGARGRPRQAAI